MGKETDTYTKGFLLGAIVGGVAGAVTALLFAPKSGAELRRDIADSSTQMYDKSRDYFVTVEDTVSKAVSKTVNEGRIKAQGIIENAKHQAEGIIENAEHVLNDAKNKAYQVKDAAKAGADTFRDEMKAADYKKG